MPTIRHCPECGTLLPDNAEGCCPICAFQGALALSAGGPNVAGADKPSDRIGRYKLLEKIGEGGWGVVYMAEQAEPIRRRVALKVVKLGMDTKQVIARFEAERQALALMDHPNIARVLDAGATDTGRPFFVMELVRGTRITDYCDEHNLSTRERLGLFIQVCHAVQHAHQKGIIHRDIKPSNILVTLLEGVPVPKVIDFGIAKATQQPLTDKTLFTAFQQFIGTPAYMSPEQVEMSGSDVDTRSDIYTLGVLLYELLTGHTPFEKQDLLKAGFDEMRRLIREKEPPRPSTRLSTLAATDLTAVARHQRTEAPKLIHLVRGDLDWIVMKCLEKERSRRYDTANDLAQDIERHLNHQPVTAAAPSASYRMRKFVRRHQLGLSMATGLVLLLIVGIIGIAWQAVRATRAEREQSQLRAEAERARKDVENQKRRVEEALNEAEAQRNNAQASLQEAQNEKTQKEKALQDSQAERGKALQSLSLAQQEKAKADSAREAARAAQSTTQKALTQSTEQRARLEQMIDFMLFDLSEKLQPIGRVELLRALSDKIVAQCQSLPQDDQSDEAVSRRLAAFNRLGYVMALQGDGTNAIVAYQTGLELASRLSAKFPGGTNWQAELCVSHQRLGELYETRGDFTAALEEFQTSFTNAQRLALKFPAETRWQASLLASSLKIGDVLRAQSDRTKALETYQTALQTALHLTQLDPDNPAWQRNLAASYGKLSSLLLQEWGGEKALEYSRSALAIAERLATRDPANAQSQSDLADSRDNLGDVFLSRKDTRRALEQYQIALQIRQRLVRDDPFNTAWQGELARSYLKLGRALAFESKKSKTLSVLFGHLKLIDEIPKRQVELASNLLTPQNRRPTLEAFQLSMMVAQQLAEKDPHNIQWQEDLAESHSLIAATLLEAGEKEPALAQFREALKVRLRLADQDRSAAYLQYCAALSHADVAVALRRLSKNDEALAETRNALHIFEGLVSRWPGNFALSEGGHFGDGTGRSLAITPEQRDEFGALLKRAFTPVKGRADNSAGRTNQEALGRYCSERGVANLLLGNIAGSISEAQKTLEVWQNLLANDPTNSLYRMRSTQAFVALAVFQLLNRELSAAIQTANRGLQLDPATTIEFKAILALAYLLEGQHDKARPLLLENRSVQVGPMQTFGEAVLDDLRRFRDKGVASIDVKAIEEMLASKL